MPFRVPRSAVRVRIMPDDLADVYRTTYPAVVRFLYRKVWDADRAEDLAQEVFIRALAHRPEKPRAWVFAVAANLARDEARAAIRFRSRLRRPLLRRRSNTKSAWPRCTKR